MKEIIQIKDWHFKIRRSNKKGYYDLIKRRDQTFFCSCPSHRYHSEQCKHIDIIEAFFGETNADESSTNVQLDTRRQYVPSCL